ncbi:hypothetical protein GIB67_023609 [Kingdonia uniflora]|uniref:Uncharacterized protein n=1 Tax=Kingdonia uniflora TaxID=39325 RepID=A0A7J7L4W7_9MAGN|nr:hypothetical protein GIB67_023609 [Kingdonia uniflora]
MAWRSGSFSRSFLSASRSASFRSSPSLPRIRPQPIPSLPRLRPPRTTFTNPRTMGELACMESLLPLHSMVAAARLTSHLAVDARACCELSQGIRSCQDR